MLEQIRNRMGLKIFFMLAVFMGVFVALMYLYIRHTTNLRYQSERDLYHTHGASVLRAYTKNCDVSMSLLGNDVEVLKDKVPLLYKDKTISFAVIYDNNSKFLYGDSVYQASFRSTESGPSAAAFVFPDLKLYSEYDEKGMYYREVKSESGELFLDIINAVKLEGQDQALGYIRIGLSLQTLERQIADAKRLGWGIIAVFVALGFSMVYLGLRLYLMPPINRLAQAAREIGQGRFDVEVPVSSRDEIGLLTSTFNDMVKNIREQTGQLQDLIDNIASAIQLMTATTSELSIISNEQAAGATEQAAIVQEVVSTTEEFAATANRIADTASSVSEAAEQTSEAAQQGKEFMIDTMRGMEHIREQVDRATKQIMELAKQAQSIGGVIGIIEEISENTNLLSLNAAIEAAGAGESGKRFGVVATEVRRLANNTLEAASSVRKMVDAIQASTTNMVMLAENEQKAVADGAESVQRMGEYFEHILERVETTRMASSEIGLITRQQSSANQQMVASIQDVEKVAREVEQGVKKIESSVFEISHLSERLAGLIGVSQQVGAVRKD